MWLKNLSFQFDNKKKQIQSWPVKLFEGLFEFCVM